MSTPTLHNDKYPEIGFFDFRNPWQPKKLQGYLSEHKTRNKDLKISEVFSVAKNKGVINQIEHLGRSFSSEDLSNYKVTFPGDLIYTKSPTADFPFGIIKQNHTGRIGLVSTLYAVFKPVSFEVGNLLHLYFLSPLNTLNYLNPLVHKGAKNTINIGNDDFLNGEKIYLPSSQEEQLKIISFVNNIDEWIGTLESQLKQLQDYKKGMMQKIFLQEIRFKDKGGGNFPSWEIKSLGDVFERVTTKNTFNNKNVLTISAQQGLVNQEKFFTKSVSSSDLTGYYYLNKGDFAYNKSYSKGYPVGAIKRLNKFENGVVSTLYICFRPKQNTRGDYFEHFFNSGFANHSISRIVQEGARNHGLLNLAVSDFFDEVSFKVPTSEEQKHIAKFLTSLDDLIFAKSQQVTAAKTWKKGLLQKMFV